jgi:hypothetical protein
MGQRFLMYALSGSSYIIALFFALAALGSSSVIPPSRRRQVLSAISAAAAVVFWFPFILTAPGLVVTPWVWSRLPARDGLRVATRMAITFGLVVGVTYLLGTVAAGVRSPAQLLAWVLRRFPWMGAEPAVEAGHHGHCPPDG